MFIVHCFHAPYQNGNENFYKTGPKKLLLVILLLVDLEPFFPPQWILQYQISSNLVMEFLVRPNAFFLSARSTEALSC